MIKYENLSASNQPFFDEYKAGFQKFLTDGWYILGDNVKNFENKFSKYNQSKHTVGLASGLDALHLSINALDLDENAEIIVPSNTYIATILAIINNGFIPILVEPNIETYNIDPEKIEGSITNKTGAILVVHLYGKACNMDPILTLAKKYSLAVIEDCAQAHGAMYRGVNVGNFGEFGAFSFYPTKNLGALGDAGAITTGNIAHRDKIRKLRNYGSEVKYYNDIIGFNSRLDEIQAYFLAIKLNHLHQITRHKRKLANLYLENLSEKFIRPVVSEHYYDVYHIFNIRFSQRDDLRKYLAKNLIQTEIHYPVPPHKQSALQCIKGISDSHFPISEEIHRTTLSLPISFSTKEKEVIKVCKILNKF
ncbi:DegT/DnrJ/EryC1/StrS family aminotransferase [bacterium]|nr:DegT/DnrJ/EryC1/StrS family aminotransferase [bacterium]